LADIGNKSAYIEVYNYLDIFFLQNHTVQLCKLKIEKNGVVLLAELNLNNNTDSYKYYTKHLNIKILCHSQKLYNKQIISWVLNN